MDQKIINLFDEYTHKPLTREEFLKRLAVLTGGTAAAMAVLPFRPTPFFANKNRAFWLLQSIGWGGYFILRTLTGVASGVLMVRIAPKALAV